MKISKFADKYDVSNDTVRYYMELNLLTPVKKGGHYHYDEKCDSQMKKLKDKITALQTREMEKNNNVIGIDNNPYLNKYLKNLLEMTAKRAKIIFITADLPVLPLQEDTVDIMVDFAGTSGYSFENEGFLPVLLNNYLKDKAVFIASFIVYEKFGPDTVVDLPYRRNFRYREIREKIVRLGFELKNEHKTEKVEIQKSIGKYEDFARIGDKLSSYMIKAKRWS